MESPIFFLWFTVFLSIKDICAFPSNLQYLPNTGNPKPEGLLSWSFGRIFIPHYVSCAMSRVKCYVSTVTCHLSHWSKEEEEEKQIWFFFLLFLSLKKLDKVVELVSGGSVIDGVCPYMWVVRICFFFFNIFISFLYFWDCGFFCIVFFMWQLRLKHCITFEIYFFFFTFEILICFGILEIF